MQLLWMLLTMLSTPLPALGAGWEEGWPHRFSLKTGALGVPALAAAHPPGAAQNLPSTFALLGLKPIKKQHVARGCLAKEGARRTDTTAPRQEHTEHRSQPTDPGFPTQVPLQSLPIPQSHSCLNPKGSKPQSLSGWLFFFFLSFAVPWWVNESIT